MSDAVHYDEVLQDLIDGRLPADAERQVRQHLATCQRCHATLEQLESGRAAAVSLRRSRAVPPALAENLAAALDAEDRQRGRAGTARHVPPARWSPAGRWVAAAVAMVAIAVAAWWNRPLNVPAQAVRDFHAVTAGELPIEFRSANPSEVEAYFVRTLDPRIRVIDLAMMGFTLEGGRRHNLGSAPSALYVYRNAGDDRIVCQMFPGSAADLPASNDTRENGGFRFHVLQRADVTLVFWIEGDIVCVLVSRVPTEALVKLAFAKAMRPS